MELTTAFELGVKVLVGIWCSGRRVARCACWSELSGGCLVGGLSWRIRWCVGRRWGQRGSLSWSEGLGWDRRSGWRVGRCTCGSERQL